MEARALDSGSEPAEFLGWCLDSFWCFTASSPCWARSWVGTGVFDGSGWRCVRRQKHWAISVDKGQGVVRATPFFPNMPADYRESSANPRLQSLDSQNPVFSNFHRTVLCRTFALRRMNLPKVLS